MDSMISTCWEASFWAKLNASSSKNCVGMSKLTSDPGAKLFDKVNDFF